LLLIKVQLWMKDKRKVLLGKNQNDNWVPKWSLLVVCELPRIAFVGIKGEKTTISVKCVLSPLEYKLVNGWRNKERMTTTMIEGRSALKNVLHKCSYQLLTKIVYENFSNLACPEGNFEILLNFFGTKMYRISFKIN
jgi:hypothetical protein